MQAGWLKSAKLLKYLATSNSKQARSKQASKLKEILGWQSMLASCGQLVKLVNYFKHALGSSMLRGNKPISSKLNRSCLKGRQIKTNKAREAESASYSQLSAWQGGQPRRNTYRKRLSQLQVTQIIGGPRRNTCRESMSQLLERLLPLFLVQSAQPIGRPRRNTLGSSSERLNRTSNQQSASECASFGCLAVGALPSKRRVKYGASNQQSASECTCLLYTSPSPRDKRQSRMPSSA